MFVFVCMCLFYYERRRQLVWFALVHAKHRARKREEKREGRREREKREAQDRIKSSSTLSSSLITIHFFDYINARQKKTRPRKCRQTAQMENNDVTDQAKKDETLFDNVWLLKWDVPDGNLCFSFPSFCSFFHWTNMIQTHHYSR
jgi:hypothetical protein